MLMEPIPVAIRLQCELEPSCRRIIVQKPHDFCAILQTQFAREYELPVPLSFYLRVSMRTQFAREYELPELNAHLKAQEM